MLEHDWIWYENVPRPVRREVPSVATCAACRQSWCSGPADDEALECVVFCDECRESMCKSELTDLYVDLGGGD